MFDYRNRVLTSKLKPPLHWVVMSSSLHGILHATVQDYENLLSTWNSSGFSKPWVTILDISETGDFLKWVAIYNLKGFYILKVQTKSKKPKPEFNLKIQVKFITQTLVISFSLACFSEDGVQLFELTLDLKIFHQILFNFVKFLLHCLSWCQCAGLNYDFSIYFSIYFIFSTTFACSPQLIWQW